jgi:RNase adaptor protein for sRNA GlmZ degradation
LSIRSSPATSSFEASLQDYKDYVRDIVQQTAANPDTSAKRIAKAAFVCKSGTHRSVAVARILQECLLRDGMSRLRDKGWLIEVLKRSINNESLLI